MLVKTQNYKSNFEVLTNIFDNMYFDIKDSPMKLHILFKDIPHIKIEIIQATYYICFRNLFIAHIFEGRLTLTPGYFINRTEEVFKTYNRLLKCYVNNRFIKYINDKWILCKNI